MKVCNSPKCAPDNPCSSCQKATAFLVDLNKKVDEVYTDAMVAALWAVVWTENGQERHLDQAQAQAAIAVFRKTRAEKMALLERALMAPQQSQEDFAKALLEEQVGSAPLLVEGTPPKNKPLTRKRSKAREKKAANEKAEKGEKNGAVKHAPEPEPEEEKEATP